ncbi:MULTISPECIES: carbohydrate kinase family protein [Aestuariimicrobium]|uniref:carbohydrate kinase family protein n=1 Tax=Aestuariimicrobium TaxID=396388 RepID=UPI0003B57E0E|nr:MULTISPECIES: PfkB family carbohydrate kinase [Aestuariimicrobium]CAI9400201.1 Sulfofructose kinase [Aestuariimicrobium sp. T2.26MG-19.2B]
MTSPTTTPYDLLACGLVFTDLIFHGIPDEGPAFGTEVRTPDYREVPGGIANASIAGSRLGLRVGMVADVGDDLVGQGSLARLRDEGIDTSGCLVHAGWQTPLTIVLNYAGDRTMVTAETPHPGRCVLRAASSPPARVVVAHLQPFPMPWLSSAAQRGALVIGDIGWDESGRWDLSALPDLPHCHAFTPNLTEALHYTRTTTVDEALTALSEHVRLPVVTMGADGVSALDRDTGERVHVAAVPGPVVDTGGAGDVFSAGLAAGLLARWPLVQSLRFAVLVSGLTVREPGAGTTAPTLADMRRWHADLDRGDPLVEEYAFLTEIPTHGPWSQPAP